MSSDVWSHCPVVVAACATVLCHALLTHLEHLICYLQTLARLVLCDLGDARLEPSSIAQHLLPRALVFSGRALVFSGRAFEF